MKKVFFEPQMQIIELNLDENIAASGETGEESGSNMYIKIMNDDYFSCFVADTGKLIFQGPSEAELSRCTVYGPTRSIGTLVPMEEVLPYVRP